MIFLSPRSFVHTLPIYATVVPNGLPGADLLLKRLRGSLYRPALINILLEPELKIRESTAAVPPRTELSSKR